MKIKEMLRDNENSIILGELIRNGYKNIKVEGCNTSMFYIKNLEDNKTQYIRKDFENRGKHKIYKYETWIRDNCKDVLDDTCDYNNKRFNSIYKLEELLNIIRMN